MSEPWFRPNGLLSYRPLTWQGRGVIALTWLVFIPLGVLNFFYAEAESASWWVTAAAAFFAFLVGHGVILWKMDWGYGQR